jgi:hypothetical protein
MIFFGTADCGDFMSAARDFRNCGAPAMSGKCFPFSPEDKPIRRRAAVKNTFAFLIAAACWGSARAADPWMNP